MYKHVHKLKKNKFHNVPSSQADSDELNSFQNIEVGNGGWNL